MNTHAHTLVHTHRYTHACTRARTHTQVWQPFDNVRANIEFATSIIKKETDLSIAFQTNTKNLPFSPFFPKT